MNNMPVFENNNMELTSNEQEEGGKMINTKPLNGTEDSMLTSKNLTILQDQLNYEALYSRKFQYYASICQDAELKNICEKAAQMHRMHFDILFNYLNDHSRPQ